MNKIIHRSDSRGYKDYGWLKTRHTFSFAGYHNPERMNFGVLRVLNDDVVKGGAGFGTHPHSNMEIVSIPLHGSMVHKDSAGHEMIISEGDVQIMSAGTGINHSEYNHSRTDDLNFLQIWVIPGKTDITPRYEQKHFPPEERRNILKTVISPSGGETLWINQDAYFTLGHADKSRTFSYTVNGKGNGIYLFVIEGKVVISGDSLERRDAVAISGTAELEIEASPDTQFLIIEIPLN